MKQRLHPGSCWAGQGTISPNQVPSRVWGASRPTGARLRENPQTRCCWSGALTNWAQGNSQWVRRERSRLVPEFQPQADLSLNQHLLQRTLWFWSGPGMRLEAPSLYKPEGLRQHLLRVWGADRKRSPLPASIVETLEPAWCCGQGVLQKGTPPVRGAPARPVWGHTESQGWSWTEPKSIGLRG